LDSSESLILHIDPKNAIFALRNMNLPTAIAHYPASGATLRNIKTALIYKYENPFKNKHYDDSCTGCIA